MSSLRSLPSVAIALVLAGCDPGHGAVGGLLFMIRTFATSPGSRFDDVESVTITFDRVQATHRASPTAEETLVDLETPVQSILLPNADKDVFVGQYSVPVGTVTQLRVGAVDVALRMKDGTNIDLAVDNPSLPSWSQSGWKIGGDGIAIPILQDELTGLRGLMHFSDRLVRPPHDKEQPPKSKGNANGNGPTWKIKPTIPAQPFVVNPPPRNPGVFLDQVTVVFVRGTAPARIFEINAEIGATVLIYPARSMWYRMKLPGGINLQGATTHYKSKPEVVAVMPGINFDQFRLEPTDGQQSNYDISRIRDAWQVAQNRLGRVGSHTIRVAMIEDSPDVTHPDLYRNIAINQGELPWRLFDTNANQRVDPAEIAAHDFDPPGAPDGIITIRDLEDPRNAAIRPVDWNGNGRVDAQDIVNSPNWVDSGDEDNNGQPDDLVGWNFITGQNRLGVPSKHATMVAGLIGAEGDGATPIGIAGVNWRVSIVPIVAALTEPSPPLTPAKFRPDVAFADAITYAESLGVEVVNISQGWHFTHEDFDFGCGKEFKNNQNTPGITEDVLRAGIAEANKAYGDLLRAGTSTLYVLAAGNNAFWVEDYRALLVPAEPMRLAQPNNVLVVGMAETREKAHWMSNYSASVVEIYAPGVNWTSLDVGGGTATGTGTSFAAPVVAGSAALLAALDIHKRGQTLRQALLATADEVLETDCGYKRIVQMRLLNAEALLLAP